MSQSSLKVVPAHRRSGRRIYRRAVRIVKEDSCLDYPYRSGRLFSLDAVGAVAFRWSHKEIICPDEVVVIIFSSVIHRVGTVQEFAQLAHLLAGKGFIRPLDAWLFSLRVFNRGLLPVTSDRSRRSDLRFSDIAPYETAEPLQEDSFDE